MNDSGGESVQNDESIQKDESISKSNKDVLVEEDDDPISLQRREKVKEAMLHAWSSYEKYAWGKDELKVFHYFIFLFI